MIVHFIFSFFMSTRVNFKQYAPLSILMISLCLSDTAIAQTDSDPTIKIETARGTETVPANIEKFVVMDVAALDSLALLGLQPIGTAYPIYVSYLDQAIADSHRIGSLFEPNIEKIHALSPDLIIVGSRSAKKKDSLGKIAPTIDMTIWGTDIISQATARIQSYGKIFRKQAEAAKIISDLQQKFTHAKASVKQKGTALILLVNGPKISVYGAAGRFGWIHNDLKIAEAFPKVEQTVHGEAISPEFILTADPDWLFVIDRNAAIDQKGKTAQQKLDNAVMRQTKAWKSQQILYLDPAAVYVASGGIQSINMILDQIINAFKHAPKVK